MKNNSSVLNFVIIYLYIFTYTVNIYTIIYNFISIDFLSLFTVHSFNDLIDDWKNYGERQPSDFHPDTWYHVIIEFHRVARLRDFVFFV